MKKPYLISMLGVVLSAFVSVPANAALIGVLPATEGGTDWQAYYDDQLDITWADYSGAADWNTIQNTVFANLSIAGVTGWRLPSMDVNGDGVIVTCSATNQQACKDNEYDYLYSYGAGNVFGSGITSDNPRPFSSDTVLPTWYWASTPYAPRPNYYWLLNFSDGSRAGSPNDPNNYGWAVQSGNVSPVPIPAAAWLFSSGLIGLLGIARRKS